MAKYSPLILLSISYWWSAGTYAFLSVPTKRHDPLLFFPTIASGGGSNTCSNRPTVFVCNASLTSSSMEEGVTTMTEKQDEDEIGNTVVSVTNDKTGQTVTLIGTAHLSEKSNDQVQRLIEALRPNVVMVEMDKSRLERIGIDSINDINVNRVTTSDDIELPIVQTNNKPQGLVGIAQGIFIQIFTKIARALLTNMYNDMGEQMNAKGGGEFLRAIQSAENCTVCDTVILGDRNSMVTIQRAAELALESGDFMGVASRLQNVNTVEMQKMEIKVRKELLQENDNNGENLDESVVTKAVMEKLKEDKEFRTRLFSKLEENVPEFTQAFLKERDYLMCESIIRELERSPEENKNVVGVVGLAHVLGMEKHFRSVFDGKPAPLIEDQARTMVRGMTDE
jgi:pheromone shutdown protein TraB